MAAPLDRGERLAPLVEGAILGLLVLAVAALAGESLRVGYGAYLRTLVGEAVLRAGPLADDPFHAGVAPRGGLLYAGLGVLLGRLGIGPLWGFACLAALAAALLPAALDAWGRVLGLSFLARRFALLLAVLAWNGLGWLGALVHPAARPHGFLQEALGAAPFALALPFGLRALAWTLRDGAERPWRAGVHVGVAAALDPLVGAHAALFAVWRMAPAALTSRRCAVRVLGAGAIAALLALPWLLPPLARAFGAGSLSALPPLAAPGRWLGLLGPLWLLALLAALGLGELPPRERTALLGAAGLAAALGLVAPPGSGAGALSRLCGALLAAPAGGLLASGWRRPLGRAAALAVLLLCLPTSWLALAATVGVRRPPDFPLLQGPDGRAWLAGAPVERLLPRRLVAAQDALPADAVLVLDVFDPAAHVPGRAALGYVMAPALKRPLLVDLPQIQNADRPDLRARLDAVSGLWTLHRTPDLPGERPGVYPAPDALHDLRAFLPDRPLALVVSMDDKRPRLTIQRARAANVAEEDGLVLWLLPPLAQKLRR